MQINKRQLKKWIAALDSGEFKQGKAALQEGMKFCCLGVACMALIPKTKRHYYGKVLLGIHPIDQLGSPDWLKAINGDFEKKTGQYLTDLNDEFGYTFGEIATLLELVYIHKMLD